MITSYQRGHLIKYENGRWLYADNGEPITDERPCIRCGKMPTKEDYDACLGEIKGATSACCGHGVIKPFVVINGRQQSYKTQKVEALRAFNRCLLFKINYFAVWTILTIAYLLNKIAIIWYFRFVEIFKLIKE